MTGCLYKSCLGVGKTRERPKLSVGKAASHSFQPEGVFFGSNNMFCLCCDMIVSFSLDPFGY